MSTHATSFGAIRARLKTSLVSKFLLWLCIFSLVAPTAPAFAAATITTTTTLATAATSVAVGTAVNLTATVTAASGSGPTGTVTFKNGTATLGTATLSGTGLTRTATYAATFTTVATNSLTAVYAGDTTNKTSTSSAKSVSSTKAAPTNTLTSSLNPSTSGASVTFTATVTGYNPTGTITFKDGTTTMGTGTLSGTGNTRTATYATTSLSVATHSITAVYAGDTLNNTVTSAALSQVVNAAAVATTTTAASSQNPSTFNTSVTFTASVTGNAPTGTVTFKDGTTTLGTGTLSGTGNTRTATYATAALSVGTHSITAVYGGGTGNLTSTSAALSQVVNAAAVATTTTLASSVNPSTFNSSVTFTASVTGTAPTGTVTFKDGTTTLGTGTLSGTGNTRTATYTTTALSVATHSITAVYAGDTGNLTSTSAALSQVVNAAVATTTTVASNLNPSTFSASVTFTASVAGTAPTGTVTFKDGTTTLGTGTLSGTGNTRTATYTTTALSVASHSITAVYAGDSGNLTSTSTALSQVVGQKVTTTALTSSVNPANVGASVTFTATVTGSSPSGTVTFKDGTTTLGTGTLSSGVATLATTSLSNGSHSVTAIYAGDTNNASSTSTALNQAIVVGTTTTVASSLNPSAAGASVTLTASVTGNAPTGNVTFKDGTTTLGTGTLSGTGNTRTASLANSFATAGSHSLTAVYAGDGSNAGSTSSAVVQTVKAVPTVTLTSSVNPTNVGQSTVLVAKVTGSSLVGVLKILDGSTVLATWNVTGNVAGFTGQLTTPFATSGTHSLTATYSGDTANADSSSTVLAQVVNSTVPVVTLTSSINPAYVYTQSPALKAKVTGTNLNGVLQILEGSTVMASWNVTGGVAGFTGTLTTNFSTVGSHNLTATYSGDSANANSSSPVLIQIVNPTPTTISFFNVSPNPVVAPNSIYPFVQLTGSNSPSGTVTFKDGNVVLGSGFVTSDGRASFIAAMYTAGTHDITAIYDGDERNAPSSTSAVVSVTVNKANTAVSLYTDSSAKYFGQSLTLTGSLNGSYPTGSITFMDGSTVLGTVPVSPNPYSPGYYNATLTISTLSTGSHNLTAVYAGDANNAGGTSSVWAQTIKALPTASITSPANGARFLAPANIPFSATAVAPDSVMNYVTFSVNGNPVGTSYQAPYSFNLTNWPAGTYVLTAAAVDGNYQSGTSSPVTINVVATNAPPVVSLTSPTNGASFDVPATISLTANASDSDGTVSQVAFYDGSTLLGTSTTAPYSFNWVNPPVGSHNLTAVAVDDLGGITTSSVAAITVKANLPPTVSITSPATGTNFANAPTSVTISASAADSDGTITQVAFYSGSTLLGTSTSAPYSFTWTNAPGGSYALTAVATDNSGNTTTSNVVNINVGTVVRITYLHNDLAGSPIAATDSTGAIVWKENYRPYGERRNVQTAGQNNRQWFHGKPVDGDTGLSYFGARYYDATLGRFMGVDPVMFHEGNYHSFNRYAYGNNNPLAFSDPDGNDPIPILWGPVEQLQSHVRHSIAAAEANLRANSIVGGVGEHDYSVSFQGGAPSGVKRFSQDVAVNPTPPAALPLAGRGVGRSSSQNAAAQAQAKKWLAEGYTDVRMDQQQVNADGVRCGVCRPDLQGTNPAGKREYIEYDRSSSNRGPSHEKRLLANDPKGTVTLIKKD